MTEDTDWVQPDACTLPTAEVPLRVAEFDELLTRLLGLDRPDRTWLRLRLTGDDGVERRARELTDAEARCCSFFTFTVTREPDAVVVDVRVPAERAEVLDGLARRAAR